MLKSRLLSKIFRVPNKWYFVCKTVIYVFNFVYCIASKFYRKYNTNCSSCIPFRNSYFKTDSPRRVKSRPPKLVDKQCILEVFLDTKITFSCSLNAKKQLWSMHGCPTRQKISLMYKTYLQSGWLHISAFLKWKMEPLFVNLHCRAQKHSLWIQFLEPSLSKLQLVSISKCGIATTRFT